MCSSGLIACQVFRFRSIMPIGGGPSSSVAWPRFGNSVTVALPCSIARRCWRLTPSGIGTGALSLATLLLLDIEPPEAQFVGAAGLEDDRLVRHDLDGRVL